ncbi:MAG: ATP-binding protein [Bacteroidota bacterium]|jgi:MinD superfamily P-loop ATPase|nr:ATP-binding protein [Bacteroidota bacterium]
MTLAVASGKGGTGKTLLATSLAYLVGMERAVTLLDLDVEEPNDHLFFTIPPSSSEVVSSMIPRIEEDYCTHCGICQKVCAYHALLVFPGKLLLFPELCKGCNGCVALCPQGALQPGSKDIGVVEKRTKGNLTLFTGRLHIGATDAPALIRAVKARPGRDEELVILDAPPGTACPAVEAVRDADFTVLVAESTPFGLHDLDLMVQTMRTIGHPFAVVVNKAVPDDDTLRAYCRTEGIDVLMEIPYSRDIAQVCAAGEILPRVRPDTIPMFQRILDAVAQRHQVTA